jgi:hypothetical protein
MYKKALLQFSSQKDKTTRKITKAHEKTITEKKKKQRCSISYKMEIKTTRRYHPLSEGKSERL